MIFGDDRAQRKVLLSALALLTLVIGAVAILSANRLIGAPPLRIVGQLKHIESFESTRLPG